MTELNCEFEIGQVVATKKNVENWAGGGSGTVFPGEILSISFDGGPAKLSVKGGYSGRENDFVSLEDAKEYAIQYLAERIKKISLTGRVSCQQD